MMRQLEGNESTADKEMRMKLRKQLQSWKEAPKTSFFQFCNCLFISHLCVLLFSVSAAPFSLLSRGVKSFLETTAR